MNIYRIRRTDLERNGRPKASIANRPLLFRRGQARFTDMFATLLTFAFLAAGLLALAVISASLAKGFAAAGALRQQLAFCSDVRMISVRHERTRARAVVTARSPRRPIRQVPILAIRARQRVAA